MKKYTKISILAALLLTCGIGANSLKAAEKIDGFEEVAQDRVGNVGAEKLHKSTFVGKDETLDVSKIFVQYGNYVKEETTYNALRFAVAVKGDISSISFQRGHVEGKKDVEEENVTTVYRGISAGNGTYYYNPEAPDAVDGLTTTEEYAGAYYWACYTVGFTDASFEVSNIPLSLTVNNIDYGSRKASLAEVRYGLHDHDYSNFVKVEEQHFKTCSLCATIDDASYENHTYDHYKANFAKTYAEGDAFSIDDLSLTSACECGHNNGETTSFTEVRTPSTASFGARATLKVNGETIDVVLPVKQYNDITLNNLRDKVLFNYGVANAVGVSDQFRAKKEYEIVDGKFSAVGDDYSYGDAVINLDLATKGGSKPYFRYSVTVAEETTLNLKMSLSNNYCRQDGVWGSYEQNLNKVMKLYVNDQETQYNNVNLKAIPQSALDEIDESAEGYLQYVYFTFYEYDLGTVTLPKGTSTLKFEFYQSYPEDGALARTDNKPMAGCIKDFTFETMDGVSEHSHDYFTNYNENKHWNECFCGYIDENSRVDHAFDISFKKEYRVGETFASSDIELVSACTCEYTLPSETPVTIISSPSGALKLGDTITVEINGKSKAFTLPVYELNIKQVPVKTDYLVGETFDVTGLILNKKYLGKTVDYETFDITQVTFEEKALTTSDTAVIVAYDEMSIEVPITVREGARTIELEDMNYVTTYTSGSAKPGSKLRISMNDDGLFKFGNTTYQTWDEAYDAAMASSSTSAATKTQVAQASNGDFLAYLDNDNSGFIVSISDVETSKMNLSIRGASNYATIIKNWVPHKIEPMVLNEFMTVEVNGEPITIADDVILPGCGDGSTGDHSYWTNWTTLNLGEITLDPSLEVNTIAFRCSTANAQVETGKTDAEGNPKTQYKYSYNNGSIAFGQYDYILLETVK